jgi:hypothetical protein
MVVARGQGAAVNGYAPSHGGGTACAWPSAADTKRHLSPCGPLSLAHPEHRGRYHTDRQPFTLQKIGLRRAGRRALPDDSLRLIDVVEFETSQPEVAHEYVRKAHAGYQLRLSCPDGNYRLRVRSCIGGPFRYDITDHPIRAAAPAPLIRPSCPQGENMNIDKDQILQLLRSQGQHDQASQASSELPDKVDTGNTQHAGMLSKYGIDPSSLGDKLAASARSSNRPPDLLPSGSPEGSRSGPARRASSSKLVL